MAGPRTPKQWTDQAKAVDQEQPHPDLVKNGAETRAAVALLSRSIKIVSGGDAAGEDFPVEASGYCTAPIW